MAALGSHLGPSLVPPTTINQRKKNDVMTIATNITGLVIPESEITPTQANTDSIPEHIRVSVADHSTVGARQSRMVTEQDFLPEREGILATAQTKTGAPEQGDITDDTVVVVNGVAMRVSAAIHEGFLAKDPLGRVYEVDAKWRAEQIINRQEQANAAAAAERVIVAPESAAEVDALRQSLENSGMDVATALSEMFLAPEGVLPKSFATLAQQTGENPDEMYSRLSNLVEAYEVALNDRLLLPAGIEPGTFWTWAQKMIPRSEHARASMRLAMRGDASMYKSFVEKYVAAQGLGKGGPSGAVYKLPAGVTSRVDSQGRTLVTVKLPSGRPVEMRFETARNMRLV